MAPNIEAGAKAVRMPESDSESRWAPWRGRAADIVAPLARPILRLLLASLLPVASTTFTIARCCTLAVRENFHEHYEQFYPWQVCNLNADIDYSDNTTYPSVTRTMGWAREHCRGAQYSSLAQWLLPLSTYISPYVGILLLCPVGDVEDTKVFSDAGWGKKANFVLYGIRKPLQEIVSILGDPASAIFGALHEIWSDARAVPGLASGSECSSAKRRQSALWVAVLAGNMECLPETRWDDDVEDALESTAASTTGGRNLLSKTAGTTTTKPTSNPDDVVQEQNPSLAKEEKSAQPSQSPPARGDAGTPVDRIDSGIKTLIAALKGFVSGILLPVLVMLAVTAATFYDAYSKRGDKDTGLALAYCVWYSWILVLGVSANCSVGARSPDVAARALRGVVKFGRKPISTALRHRYVNRRLWYSWATAERQNRWDHRGVLGSLDSEWNFWAKFCAGQLLGFCCVAFSSGCAAAISWTTPTTGLGCRSFNFILYAVLAFATAYLHVLCTFLSVRAGERRDTATATDTPASPSNNSRIPPPLHLIIARFVYWLLVLTNALVMVLGTLFHLVGVFRTCWCENLTWNDATVIELNSKTAQAVENARRYWLSTAYVGFGGVWLACLTAILFRGFIVQSLDKWVDSREEEDE
ncbi:uncharacterized protein DNG_09512 [Cephalotrichum gorgonifer]|uniref:Uncharacterized protein n=1 Tax=Cephalotrichum gorgonifer TaxID=2041049 RepID=A0AAE8N7W2_9PEZI|nr:uncharacterized protein DNG_09512 [Cephalotrichum gorgonifer]